MKNVLTVVLVLFLLTASTTYFTPTVSIVNGAQAPNPNTGTQGAARRFGFGFVGGAALAKYGASTFFQAMFLTPPYPSTIEFTLNNGIQDINDFGNAVHQVMALAAPYPNIKMGIDVAFDVSSPSEWATFTNWLQGMASDPNAKSIGYIGFAVEQLGQVTTSKNSTWQQNAFSMFQSRISSTPFQFISYYPQSIQGGIQSGWAASYLFMFHTNYPHSDPQVFINGGVGQSNIVGITHGLDAFQMFPSIGCSDLGSSGNYAQPGWSTVSFPQGYLPPGFTGPPPHVQPCNNAVTGNGFPPTIDQALSADNSNPLANRLWDNFVAGNAGTDYSGSGAPAANFIGVSGLTTHFLWDSPIFRAEMSNWLANNPNTFLTSNGKSPPRTTTTTLTTTSTSSIFTSSTSLTSSTASSTRTTSSTSTTTKTTVSSSTVSSTSRASSSSSTTSSVTTTSSTSTRASQTSSQVSTTSGTTTQGYALVVSGACPTTGDGIYPPGSTATVWFAGVCGRNGESGLRVTSYSVDGGMGIRVDTNATVNVTLLMDRTHTLQLYTVTQYSLTLDYGGIAAMLTITPTTIPGDAYWYDSGTLVQFTGAAQIPNFNVVGWVLEGGVVTPVSGVPDFTAAIPMVGPHTLSILLSPVTTTCASGSCVGTPKFDITIQTNASLPSGVWIDGAYYPHSVAFAWQGGSAHNITAADGVRQSSVRSTFIGWSGISGSRARTIVLKVNESGHLVAGYAKDYLVTLAFADASGAPLAPQSVTLKGPSGVQTLGDNLSAWLKGGSSYTVTSAFWMSWNVVIANQSTFVVDRPGARSFSADVYLQTVRVTDVWGLPLRGATVNVTTLNGIVMSTITNDQGIAQFKVPSGLFSAVVTYLGVSSQIVAGSAGGHFYTVSFVLSYPFLVTVWIVSVITCAFVLLRLRKREPKSDIVFFSDST